MNPVLTEHRLTWRMWHPVHVFAFDRDAAIAEALRTQPAHIPAGTELYYGMVGGTPVGKATDKTANPNQNDNEADCGGVFDGNGVISDADQGL